MKTTSDIINCLNSELNELKGYIIDPSITPSRRDFYADRLLSLNERIYLLEESILNN